MSIGNNKDFRSGNEAMAWANSYLSSKNIFLGHGSEEIEEEIYLLVLHVLSLDWRDTQEYLQIELEKDLDEAKRAQVMALVYQRARERIPLPYLLNKSWFAGREYYVDERVLIPRSPLAEFLHEQVSIWLDVDEVETVLDLCTGSACIAIACADTFPNAKVDASELSDDALEVARINVDKHRMQQRVELFHSDLFRSLNQKPYDLIISNPPYVDAEDMANLPEEYQHEPELALAAGSDGLAIVAQILRSAKDYLSEDGILVVEVGNSEQALCEKYPEVPFMWLEFDRGGHGVFMLNRKQILEHCETF